MELLIIALSINGLAMWLQELSFNHAPKVFDLICWKCFNFWAGVAVATLLIMFGSWWNVCIVPLCYLGFKIIDSNT